MFRATATLVIALITLLAACSDDATDRGTSSAPTSTDPSPEEAALATTMDRWESTGPASYRFTIEVVCFCPPEARGPFEVTVTDGQPTEALLAGQPAGDQAPDELFTVAGLFQLIESSLGADAMTVEYDQQFGHPTMIDIDPRLGLADDERQILVSSFSGLS